MTVASFGRVFDDITQCVGNTPLVRLRRIAEGCVATVAGKLENMNPLWSVKDRIAVAMIDDAEQKGLIGRDTVVIEPTSGNTGIGLAYVCAARIQARRDHARKHEPRTPPAAKGPRRRDRVDAGRRWNARRRAKGGGARGGKLELLHAAAVQESGQPRDSPQDDGRGDLRDTAGAIDVVVVSVGTGGTITGVGEVLKARKPGVRVVAVEPAASPVISQRLAGQPLKPGRHAIQGIGAGFIPDVLNLSVIDEVIQVGDEDAMETSRQLARQEGFLCGISAGAAAWAALQFARRPASAGKLVVAILPDLGERYLSTKLFPE